MCCEYAKCYGDLLYALVFWLLKSKLHFLKFMLVFNLANKYCVYICRQEIRDGADILRKKIALYRPKIAVFNGKGKI